jgi:hypothetical protein
MDIGEINRADHEAGTERIIPVVALTRITG